MKSEVKDINQCMKVLTIDVTPHIVKESFDQFYNEISKTAKVPGFRAGKVPRNVLTMHYSNQAREEVLKRLVSSSYHQAVQKHNINPVGYPVFEDIDFSNDKLSYKAKIETKPVIKLKKYKNISAKREKFEVSDSEVQNVVDNILEGYAKYIPIEDRGLEIGNYAVCDIESIIEGEKPELKKDEWVEIRENDLIKGFAEQTIGMKPGDEKEINVKISEKFPNPKVQGKKAVFKVKIKDIKEKRMPELTPELLKEIGDYSSVDDLKQAIRKDLEERKKNDNEYKLERSLLDIIEGDLKFDLPETIVQNQLSRMVKDASDNMLKRGFTKEEVLEKEEDLRKEFLNEARRQVKVAFILDKIAELENINTEEADIQGRFMKISRQTGQPVEKIKEYYKSNNLLESLFAEIRNQKVIDFIKDNAEIL